MPRHHASSFFYLILMSEHQVVLCVHNVKKFIYLFIIHRDQPASCDKIII